jgi:hypothetical protein
VGAPLMSAGRYEEGNERWWMSVSMKGRRWGGELVGYPPPMGGGRGGVSRRWRQPARAHSGGAFGVLRKETVGKLGWYRAEKAGVGRCAGRPEKIDENGLEAGLGCQRKMGQNQEVSKIELFKF